MLKDNQDPIRVALFISIFTLIGAAGYILGPSRAPDPVKRAKNSVKGAEAQFADIPVYDEEEVMSLPDKPTQSIPVVETNRYFRIVKIGQFNRKPTTYSIYDKNDRQPGHPDYGKYANNKFGRKLHRSERYVHTSHYTVAVTYKDRGLHNSIIQLPDGTRTHKYRLHVPHYNSDSYDVASPDSYLDNRSQKLLRVADSSFFSVPRDRMSHKKGNCRYCREDRIDILHTGYEASVKKKQRWWMSNIKSKLPIDVYEIRYFVEYSDGTVKQLALPEIKAGTKNGKVILSFIN
ncbi:hypothetical protein DRO66_05160 [Candidatus Bathyarchaeota archaeon]|nr:MAG: hypothetical protein DRO66_05160 [Candidatus Bathyarchaeota archaeon]